MWNDRYSRVDDAALCIEAIRRQRPRRIPNVADESYVGANAEMVLESLSLWCTNYQLRDLVNRLIHEGHICLAGQLVERTGELKKIKHHTGLITRVHPDFSISHEYFLTPAGTPKRGADVRDPQYVWLRLKTFYVTADGVPLKIKKFLNNGEYIYPW